jgi:hypothetical protein
VRKIQALQEALEQTDHSRLMLSIALQKSPKKGVLPRLGKP